MGIVDELKKMFNMSESRRRFHVGMEVAFWQAGGLGIIGTFPPRKKDAGNPPLLPDVTLGDLQLTRKQLFEMLRRSKMLLSMRRADAEVAKLLERRKEWNIARLPVIENNLDLFPAVKYSYSSRRPGKNEISLVVSDGGNVRFDGVVRSCNMRLDPVDAVRIAYKKRKEIQRALQWGYDNGQIPVMLTFTIFHDWTWQPLDKLIAVLRNSYDDIFDHKVGGQFKDKIGFRYRIFRMEETIDMKNPLAAQNDTQELSEDGACENEKLEGKHDGHHGWHPHYHVILFVPKANLSVLDELESKLKTRWKKLVQKHYAKVFGKEIPESYLPALYEHGLMISRYSEDVKDENGDVIHKQGDIYQVNDTDYFAKIMGCDSAEMYGGDKELTNSLNKNAICPFDLLRVPPTAEIADLWNEYAIATKGKSCFRFARGFKAVIDEYFKQHPDRDPVSAMSRPKEFSIVGLKDEVYHLLYRNLKVVEVKRIITNFVKSAGFNISKAYDFIYDWLKKLFVGWGLPEPAEEDLFVVGCPPD